ncbi:MAG: type II toxin-antitoxin system HicB family antitoxin [Methanothrix sp.]|nr:type II toxin-antitoxin system HicB family antitoxin [Methanothrix sp.]
MKFHITFERDEDGRYVAECTDLPGCLSEGDSPEEAMENISEAIIGCLKSRLKKTGEKLKIPSIDGKFDISIDVTEPKYCLPQDHNSDEDLTDDQIINGLMKRTAESLAEEPDY